MPKSAKRGKFSAREQILIIQLLEQRALWSGSVSECMSKVSAILRKHRRKVSRNREFVNWPDPARCRAKIVRFAKKPFCPENVDIYNFCHNGPKTYDFQFCGKAKTIFSSTLSHAYVEGGEIDEVESFNETSEDSEASTAPSISFLSVDDGHTTQEPSIAVVEDLAPSPKETQISPDIPSNGSDLNSDHLISLLQSEGSQRHLLANTLRFSQALDNIEREISCSQLVESDVVYRMLEIEQTVHSGFSDFIKTVKLSSLTFERLSGIGSELGATLFPSSTDQAYVALGVCQVLSQVHHADILVGLFNASLFRWVFQDFAEDHDGVFQNKVREILQCTGESGDYVRSILAKKMIHDHLIHLRRDASELRRKSAGHALHFINVLNQICTTQPINIDDFQQHISARTNLESVLTGAYLLGYSTRIEFALNTNNQYAFYLPKACQEFDPIEMANDALRPKSSICLCRLFGIKVMSSEVGAIERVLCPASVI